MALNPNVLRELYGEQEPTINPLPAVKGITPDTAGQALQISKQKGIDSLIAAKQLPQLQDELDQDQWDAFVKANPISSRKLSSDPVLAAAAKDNMEGVGAVESGLTQFRKKPVRSDEFRQMIEQIKATSPGIDDYEATVLAGKTAYVDDKSAFVQAPQGPEGNLVNAAKGLAAGVSRWVPNIREGVRRQFGDLLGLETVQADAAKKSQRLQNEAADTTPQFKSSTAGAVYSGADSVLRIVPSVVTSIVTKNPAAGLALMGVDTQTNAYNKYRNRGGSAGEAFTGAALEAGVEVGTEMMPMKFLTEKFGKAGMGEFLTGYLAKEMPTEQIATFLQDATDTAIANPNKTWEQFLAERPGAAYETAVATLVTGGVLAGASRAASKLDYFMQPEEVKQQGEALQRLQESMRQAAPLAMRSPDSFAQLVQAIADETGDAPKEVWVSANMLYQAAQSAGMTIEQLAPSAAPGFEVALESNADVPIPVGEWAARIATQPAGDLLLQHLKTEANGLSVAEAQAYEAEQAAMFQQEANKIMAQKQDEDAFVKGAQIVNNQIYDQLQQVGQNTPEVNRTYANFVRDFYVTMANAYGITPDAMYAKIPYSVTGENMRLPEIPADITRSLAEAKTRPQTYLDNSPEREALRERTRVQAYEASALDAKKQPVEVKQGKRLDIVLGRPASGKSSAVAEPLQQKHGSRLIDSDAVKEMLPEFDNGLGAHAVHEESSMIARDVYDMALANGDNIVLPVVGSNFTSLLSRIEFAKEAGYHVAVHHVDLPMRTAVERAISRYRETGRLVNPENILQIGNKVRENFDTLRAQGGSNGIQGSEGTSADLPAGNGLGQPVPGQSSPELQGDPRVQHGAVQGGNPGQEAGGAARLVDEFHDYSNDVPRGAAPKQFYQGRKVAPVGSLEDSFAVAKAGSFNTNRELKAALQEAVLNDNKGVDLSTPTPENQARLIDLGVRDALYALKSNANAVGWYDDTVTRAMNVLTLIHPELGTDPDARFAFTWALAVTSNGIKVDKNFELAESAYRVFKQTGKMPTDVKAGQAQKAINEGLGLYNKMVEELGPEALRQFMVTNFTVAELKRLTGEGFAGENADTVARGALVLGPKIGNGFFSNLNGYFDQLTMDRWLMRTWGRWTGTLLELRPDMEKAKGKELKAAVAELKKDKAATKAFEAALKGKLNTKDLNALALQIQKASVDPDNRAVFNLTPAGESVRKIGNALAKYLDAQKEAPENGNERNFIRAVFKGVLDKLQEDPRLKKLTMSDLQALLWYPERRLYDAAKATGDNIEEGYEDDEAPDYANAAAGLARGLGFGSAEIEQAARGERPAAARPGDEQQSEAGVEGRVPGLDERARAQFLRNGIIRQLRSNRGGDAKSSGPFERRGRGDGKSVRVLGFEPVAQFKPAKAFANAYKLAGMSPVTLYELGPEAAATFQEAITKSKNATKFGAAVYVYSEEEYAGMRLFLSEDGTTGFALKGQDIVSVFNHGPHKNAANSALELAVQEGGRTLDAFDTVLPELYAPHGFRIVSRMKWNDEYAPEGWDKSVFAKYNNGEPDVVFMAYDANYFGRPTPEQGQYFEDYDQAVEHQLKAINDVHVGKVFFQPAVKSKKSAPDWVSPEIWALHEASRNADRYLTNPHEHPLSATPKGITESSLRRNQTMASRRLLQAIKSAGFSDIEGIDLMRRMNMESRAREQSADGFNQDARGGFDPASLTTVLNKEADLSTFLHETSHFFLEAYSRLAADPMAPQSIKDDMQQILDWFGIKDLAEWNAMDVDAQRKYHEQFAYNYEIYLFEGKAPSVKMQSMFDRFSAWLKRVYVSIRDDLNRMYREQFGQDLPGLTPEIRGVFDRMLASEERIKEAEQVRQMVPLFQSAEEAGMDAGQWTAYQSMSHEGTQEAISQHEKASLREMRWLANARGKVLKDLQKQAAEARSRVKAEVEAEVLADPIYRAMRFLKHGEVEGETGAKFKIDDAALRGAKFNIKDLEQMFPATGLNTVDWKKLGYGKHGMLSDAGLHPDMVADMFGFSSGEVLVRSLLDAPPIKDVVEAGTDLRMLEQHSELHDPREMERAVDRALHNEARARFIGVELRALARANKPVRSMLNAAKQAAALALGKTKVKDIRPNQFSAAEARAAKQAGDAMRKGDTQLAILHKRNQLLNNVLTANSHAALDELAKAKDLFKRVFAADSRLEKSRNMDLVNVARAILSNYGIGPSDQPAQAYLDLVKSYDPSLYAELSDMLETHKQRGKELKELTLDEMRQVRDEVATLWHLSRRSKQMMVDGKLEDRADIATQLAARLQELGVVRDLPGMSKKVTNWEKTKVGLLGLVSRLRRVEAWADMLDGGNANGLFHKYIYQPVADRTTEYRLAKRQLMEKYLQLFEGIQGEHIGRGAIEAPEIGYTFENKAELLHAMLHLGNDSNRRKLLLGRRWGSETETGQLDSTKFDAFMTRLHDTDKITKADWDFVQGVWDLLEEMKPQAQKAHHDLYGRYFSEVTAQPVETPFGVYRGGYVPALVDPSIVADALTRNDKDALEQGGNSYMFPTTGRGFTKSRVEYNRPLALNLGLLPSHMDKVLRFSIIEPTIRDVARLTILPGGLRGALDRVDPTVANEMLTPWLQRTAQQFVEEPAEGHGGRLAARFFREVRTRTGMQIMVGNVVNAMQQMTGLSIAAVKVPKQALLRALWQYTRGPGKMADMVAERSPFMETRLRDQSFEIAKTIDEMILDPTKFDQVKAFAEKHGYFLQQGFQNVVDVITWAGAYDTAIAKGLTDLEAVREADSAVRLTQGSLLPENVSKFESNSSFVRLFTQFANYFNMQANLYTSEFTRAAKGWGVKKGMGHAFYVYVYGFMIPALVSELIVRGMGPGFDDDDDGDVDLVDLLRIFFFGQARSAAALVPVAGQVGNALVNLWTLQGGHDDRISTAPAVTAVESAARAPVSVYKAVVEEGSSKRAIRDTLMLLGLISGLPVSWIGRPLGFAADVAEDRVVVDDPTDYVTGALSGRGERP